MNLNQYSDLAYRTCKKLSQREHVAHMALGVWSEMLEMKAAFSHQTMVELVENLKEEIGDISWYLLCLRYNPETDTPVYDYQDLENIADSDIEQEEYLASLAKKIFVYFDQDQIAEGHINLCNIAEKMLKQISMLADEAGIGYVNCLDGVIEKLKVRYPEKYSSVDALERKDKNV